ncbi:hypothetical protein [Desulfovibrio sp. 86]|uniref:hypothetical protein n=1 Tax=Desulfovibrio sp. 86 TaxID=2666132 RepID=UPI0015D46901|nr:hypothetical protein [Desulfovibrio sp. 86]
MNYVHALHAAAPTGNTGCQYQLAVSTHRPVTNPWPDQGHATQTFEPEPERTRHATARDFQGDVKVKTNFIFNLFQAASAVKAGRNYLNKLFRQVTTIHPGLPLRLCADLSTTGGKSGILAR